MHLSSILKHARIFHADCTILDHIYSEKIVDEAKDIEKCVEEGPSDNASKVFGEKSEEGS
jgi:hypothetical protein